MGVSLLITVLALGLLTALAYAGRVYWAWMAPVGLVVAYWGYSVGWYSPPFLAVAGGFLLVAIVTGTKPIRRAVISAPLLKPVAAILPKMGETERIALEAGTVWWDGQLFTGDPKWSTLFDFKGRALTERERAFLEGPAEEVCRLCDNWQVEQDRDLSPEVWEFLKKNKFFGIIIPEEYGGLGFSAAAHSAVVLKLASRNSTLGSSVMVPNSLGPAELIWHYGTKEQKDYYLPRLAVGEEIPCFALTAPEAGSDATAQQSIGVICRGTFNGKEVLGMRLNFRKRYATLSPVATVIGLAFKLQDPEHLLGQREDLGITCALIPSNLPGIDIGKRHDPIYNQFLNGPIYGKDVFAPLDFIIGGPAMAGQGWRMLMQCLAAGRGISLPASASAAAQVCTRGVGAYATIREQFEMPIGKFEGIEEPLSRIGGLCYVMNAARTLTAAAVDSGQKPAVVSAIVKRYLTEAQRQLTNDAMDILGGAGISRGPRNFVASAYTGSPIGVTVEGANILTRCLIIFGQGAIRCHPFVQEELRTCSERDVVGFDRAFFGHIGFVIKNMFRSFLLGLTDGSIAQPDIGNAHLRRYLGRFTRMSAAFALVSDLAMATLGAQLKRSEKLSGRLADALAWLYLGSATMKRYYDEGQPSADTKFLVWGCDQALYEIQTALAGIIDNLPNRAAAGLLRFLTLPLGQRYHRPSDRAGSEVARALLENRDERLELSRDIYSPPATEPGLGRMEAALSLVVAASAVQRKVREAVKAGKLARKPEADLLERAVSAAVITTDEREAVRAADAARDDIIQVDEFTANEFPAVSHQITMTVAQQYPSATRVSAG